MFGSKNLTLFPKSQKYEIYSLRIIHTYLLHFMYGIADFP